MKHVCHMRNLKVSAITLHRNGGCLIQLSDTMKYCDPACALLLSLHLSFYLFISYSVCLSITLPACLSDSPSASLSASLSLSCCRLIHRAHLISLLFSSLLFSSLLFSSLLFSSLLFNYFYSLLFSSLLLHLHSPLMRVIYPVNVDRGVPTKVCALAQIVCSTIPT